MSHSSLSKYHLEMILRFGEVGVALVMSSNSSVPAPERPMGVDCSCAEMVSQCGSY
jgi:hypothetical protein